MLIQKKPLLNQNQSRKLTQTLKTFTNDYRECMKEKYNKIDMTLFPEQSAKIFKTFKKVVDRKFVFIYNLSCSWFKVWWRSLGVIAFGSYPKGRKFKSYRHYHFFKECKSRASQTPQ